MTGRIDISPNELDLNKYAVYKDVEPFDYSIEIITDLSESYEDLTSNVEEIKRDVADQIDYYEKEEDRQFYRDAEENIMDLINNAEYIHFNYPVEQIAEYIDKNPILKNKKIVFNDIFDLTPATVKKVEEAFNYETSNICFMVVGNSNLITFEEYRQTVQIIDSIVKEIKQFNFSPLEAIMYTYDLVRNRIYKEVDENENLDDSRSLSSVLLGEKIVCLGYSNIMMTILRLLGLDCYESLSMKKNEDSGHARVEVKIDDPKYGVKGIYYFDPTWDSKKKEDDNSYLNCYAFFAMTLSKMAQFDKGRYIYDDMPAYSNDIVKKVEDILINKGIEHLDENLRKTINYIIHRSGDKLHVPAARLLSFMPKNLVPSEEKILKSFKKGMANFQKTIDAETLLEVLFNVRKIQYYTDPEKYPFDVDSFRDVYQNSGWCFKGKIMRDRLLLAIDKNLCIESRNVQMAEYVEERKLDLKIEQVKFTRLLREQVNNKALKR